MNDTTPSYYDLKKEDTWIEYLRARLPFSFKHISEEKPKGEPKHFQLSDPVLLTPSEPAERHNFWKRGNVYYMTGKLMDYYSMSEVGWLYRLLEVTQLLTRDARARVGWPTDAFTFYNSMQMEKVWGFVQENHLDRERVMMTNIILSAELCLKAIMTHATFWETKCFKFSPGHDVVKLFEGSTTFPPRRNRSGVESIRQRISRVQDTDRRRNPGNSLSPTPTAAMCPPCRTWIRGGVESNSGKNKAEPLHGLCEQQRPRKDRRAAERRLAQKGARTYRDDRRH